MNNKSFKFSPSQEQTIIKSFQCIIKNAQNKKSQPEGRQKVGAVEDVKI